jgi:hypothetical protein
VYTHGATHEWQHDWLEVRIPQHGKMRSLVFDDVRGKSGFVAVTLAPGQTDWQTVDVADWARRQRNAGIPLLKGDYRVQAIYDTSREQSVWAGRLETSFSLQVR